MLSEATYVLAVGNGRGACPKFVVCGNDFATQVAGMIAILGSIAPTQRTMVYANFRPL
jgi:hypothetical protein